MKTTSEPLPAKTLIIVTGGPGTGKSYTAHQILRAFPSLTSLSYDSIKEKEWDRFGFDNAAEKLRLNNFCLEEFYLILGAKMRQGQSLLIEYPFSHRHRDRLWELIRKYRYHAVTVLLEADWSVVYKRFVSRNGRTDRHPGHLTDCYHKGDPIPEGSLSAAPLTYEEFRADIDSKLYDIRLGNSVYVDVTDFTTVHYPEMIKKIRRAAEPAE